MTESILQQVASGDAAAMSEFLKRFSGLVWSLARRQCPTAQDAEDATQEIFMEIWRSASRYDESVSSEQTFVAMIARRRLIDRARRVQRAGKAEAVADLEMVPAEETVDHVEVNDEAQKVSALLSQLRPEQQQVIELSVLHGRSHRQIAEQTGMPLGTVKSLARRGLNRIRESLGVGTSVDPGVAGPGPELAS